MRMMLVLNEWVITPSNLEHYYLTTAPKIGYDSMLTFNFLAYTT